MTFNNEEFNEMLETAWMRYSVYDATRKSIDNARHIKMAVDDKESGVQRHIGNIVAKYKPAKEKSEKYSKWIIEYVNKHLPELSIVAQYGTTKHRSSIIELLPTWKNEETDLIVVQQVLYVALRRDWFPIHPGDFNKLMGWPLPRAHFLINRNNARTSIGFDQDSDSRWKIYSGAQYGNLSGEWTKITGPSLQIKHNIRDLKSLEEKGISVSIEGFPEEYK